MNRRPDGTYSIDSMSDRNCAYVVDPKAGTCSCPHFTMRLAAIENAECKHIKAVRDHIAQQTALGRAAEKAVNLTDQELLRFAKERAGTAAGAACLLELACRRRLVQAENQPEVDLVHHTCTCREFTERRDGKRIGVMVVTCRHLQAAKKAAQPAPRPIPAWVEAFLMGATPEERERCLEIYR